MTTYDQLPDGAMFIRPDTVDPHRVYTRTDARNYTDADRWLYGRGADESPIDCKAEPVEVHAWADGYGIWHCRVTGPDLAAFRDVTAHGLALDTVRDELAQRSGPGYDPLSVLVRRESVDVLPGGRVAIQYGERSA